MMNELDEYAMSLADRMQTDNNGTKGDLDTTVTTENIGEALFSLVYLKCLNLISVTFYVHVLQSVVSTVARGTQWPFEDKIIGIKL